MSTLPTCFSYDRPQGFLPGDSFFELDTKNLIIYNGESWDSFSPKTVGADISDNFNYHVSTPGNLFSIPNLKDGDFVYITFPEELPYVVFEEVNVYTSTYDIYIPDHLGERFHFRGERNNTNPDYFDIDTDNRDTPQWQGFYNFKDSILSKSDNFTVEVYGDNNHFIKVSHKYHSSTPKFASLSHGYLSIRHNFFNSLPYTQGLSIYSNNHFNSLTKI